MRLGRRLHLSLLAIVKSFPLPSIFFSFVEFCIQYLTDKALLRLFFNGDQIPKVRPRNSRQIHTANLIVPHRPAIIAINVLLSLSLTPPKTNS